MTRVLHWSLLVGCLGVGGVTANSAWEVASCPSPLAALSSEGWDVRLPALASAEELELRTSQDVALVAPR